MKILPLAKGGALLVLAFQVVVAPSLWTHTSSEPVIMGRWALDYFALLVAYHLMMLVWAGLTVRLMLCTGETCLENLRRSVRHLVARPLLFWGTAAGLWGAMIVFSLLSATRAVPSLARAAPLVTLAFMSLLILVLSPLTEDRNLKKWMPHINRGRSLLGKVPLADGVVVLGFALFATVYFLGRWRGMYPFVFLGGDAANIASFVAGRDHPGLFGGDAVLGDPDNFRIYSTVHLPIIRALARLTGDYGSAFIYLLGPHVFLQALGFYILGRVVFQSRYWAALLAVVTLMPIRLNLGEYWGIYQDPQPRFTFQALLPYILTAAFVWRSRPTAWPWLLGFAGALMYVHPVSAPAWGLAIWSGLWAFQPASWSFAKRLAYMLFVGAVFLVVAFPSLAHYLQNHTHGATVYYNQVYEIMVNRFTAGHLDAPDALQQFALIVGRQVILPLSAVGAVLVLKFRQEDRTGVLLIGLWLVGLLVTSAAIPFAEHTIARIYNLMPIELSLVRDLRYIVPIMLLFCLWPLAEISKKLESPEDRWVVAVVGALLVGVWTYSHPPEEALKALSCWERGEIVCPSVDGAEQSIQALDAMRRLTPPGSHILSAEREEAPRWLSIRYYALRPMVYSYKDGGILAYTNHAELLRWYEKDAKMTAVIEEQDDETRLEEFVALSREWDAQYLLTDFGVDPTFAASLNAEVIYTNDMYTLILVTAPHAQSQPSP